MQIGLYIVDDDGWIVNGVKSIIPWEDYGFTILGEAFDSFTAYDEILRLKPDLVFTDIIMPESTGLELIKRLKSKKSEAEFVVLTGYAEFSYAMEACKLGAFDYLLKPLEKAVLLDTLERFRQKYSIMRGIDDGSTAPIHSKSVSTNNKTLQHMLNYIKENYSSRLHLYEIAEKFHFNANYISQLFSKELGISFSEYITQYRLDIAEKMFLETNAPVKEVCSKVGIDDYFYFNRIFKKYKGMTPSQLRSSQHVKN